MNYNKEDLEGYYVDFTQDNGFGSGNKGRVIEIVFEDGEPIVKDYFTGEVYSKGQSEVFEDYVREIKRDTKGVLDSKEVRKLDESLVRNPEGEENLTLLKCEGLKLEERVFYKKYIEKLSEK